jgi:hypothetical protein
MKNRKPNFPDRSISASQEIAAGEFRGKIFPNILLIELSVLAIYFKKFIFYFIKKFNCNQNISIFKEFKGKQRTKGAKRCLARCDHRWKWPPIVTDRRFFVFPGPLRRIISFRLIRSTWTATNSFPFFK